MLTNRESVPNLEPGPNRQPTLTRLSPRSGDNVVGIADDKSKPSLLAIKKHPHTQPAKPRDKRELETFFSSVRNLNMIVTPERDKPTLQRMRSRSLDSKDIPERHVGSLHKSLTSSNSGSAKHIQSAMCEPRLVVDAPKLFWRTRLSSHVFVYFHDLSDCFEVISYSYDHETELNRLYIPRSPVYDIVKESTGIHLVRAMRPDMFEQILLRCAGDYLCSAVEVERDSTSTLPCLYLRRYEGMRWCPHTYTSTLILVRT